MSKQESIKRYTSAQKKMQSGVAAEMNHLKSPTEPKHLRVGVNVALCDHAALVKTLVEAGVITEDAYFANLADVMEQEVARYEKRLTKHYGGAKITLGEAGLGQ